VLVADQAQHIQEALDSALSLLEQNHELLGFPVLGLEAASLEDVLKSLSRCELKSLVLANVVPMEAREHIVFSQLVAVFGEKIVFEITFFGSLLPIDYRLCLG